MKVIARLLAAALLAALFLPSLSAQDQRRELNVMEYYINGKDTIYLDEIPPAVIHPRQTMSKRDWVKYYKRVHNFSKAYPYALMISQIINETDSTIEAGHFTKRQKEKYLSKKKDELLKDFDPVFRKLTLKQGLMMIRLIDRECGTTPYYILKNYLGGATASFWQGVAKLLKGNLKQPYDRFGEDKDLEELVDIWQRGEFDNLYWMIFGKSRPEIIVPERYK
jgi:hypothetical protein